MRISDWSSDVCSSDLVGDAREPGLLLLLGAAARDDRAADGRRDHHHQQRRPGRGRLLEHRGEVGHPAAATAVLLGDVDAEEAVLAQIGSASCRDSVCQYVWISVVAVDLKTKKT